MPSVKSKEFAEFIGIILGDGSLSIYGQKNKHYRLKITFNSKDDKEYIFYAKKLIKDLFGIDPILKYRKNENTADLFLFKREIIRFLLRFGLVLSPKWERAIIPNSLLKDGLDTRILRGYFDTDGCVALVNNNGTLYPRLEMKISPSPMQSQLVGILKKYCFSFGVYSIGKGKVRVQLNGLSQLKRWTMLVGFSNQKNLRKALYFLS